MAKILLLERYISNFTRYYFLYAEFSDFLCQPISRWTNYITFPYKVLIFKSEVMFECFYFYLTVQTNLQHKKLVSKTKLFRHPFEYHNESLVNAK
jgi:hypothetical protein